MILRIAIDLLCWYSLATTGDKEIGFLESVFVKLAHQFLLVMTQIKQLLLVLSNDLPAFVKLRDVAISVHVWHLLFLRAIFNLYRRNEVLSFWGLRVVTFKCVCRLS